MTQITEGHAGQISKPSLRVDVAALALGVLLISTAILKFTLYARQPLGLDETFTAMIAGQPNVGALLHQCQLDVYAPLSYIVSWAWAQLSGLSNAALRFPSAAFACLAPLVALAPSRLFPRPIRMTWAALLACWLPGFLFAEVARCYTLLLLLGTANAVAFVGLLRAPNLLRAVTWTAISSLFILDHYFAAILVACQGVTYLAVHKKAAVSTWPAALAFVPTFVSILLKAPLLISYSRPGVSWMPLLRLRDLPEMADYLTGTTVVLYAILAWAGIGIVLNWRAWRDRPGSPGGDAARAIFLAAVVAVAATGFCLGLGFLKALLIPRYLTSFVPGLMLALALLAQHFRRGWNFAPAALLIVPVGLVIAAFVYQPPRGSLPTLAFEGAAQTLAENKIKRLVFFWDNPLAQTVVSQQFEQVGGFFFMRAGHPIPVDVPTWTKGVDPNPLLLSHLRLQDTAMIWIYDLDRPGTLAIRHPPRLAALDPSLTCHDFAGGRLGVLACSHRRAAAS